MSASPPRRSMRSAASAPRAATAPTGRRSSAMRAASPGPQPPAADTTRETAIQPTATGPSPACDGQVLVLEDMLGLSPWVPKFVKRYGNLGPGIEAAIQDYAREVRSRAFPG